MHIEHLSIANLRNHKETEVDFCSSINVIHGLNGSGKTTILEAINICSLSKSFLSVAEASLVNSSADSFFCACQSKNDLEAPYRVAIRYQPGRKKQITSSIGDNLIPKEIVGELPLVVLSPDNKTITGGTPEDRRQFMDRAISQISKVYIEDLVNLRKCLKQRNNLLQNSYQGYIDHTSLDLWTQQLIKLSASIVFRRNTFIKELSDYFHSFYEKAANNFENPQLIYTPDKIDKKIIDNLSDKKQLIEFYSTIASILKKEELRRGRTLFGPQKDDLKIMINGGLARDYASQGQHKSLLISLKLAEFAYLKDTKNETPIFIIDDLFSELDDKRIELTLSVISAEKHQTFITMTNPEFLKTNLASHSTVNYYLVDKGEVIREQ